MPLRSGPNLPASSLGRGLHLLRWRRASLELPAEGPKTPGPTAFFRPSAACLRRTPHSMSALWWRPRPGLRPAIPPPCARRLPRPAWSASSGAGPASPRGVPGARASSARAPLGPRPPLAGVIETSTSRRNAAGWPAARRPAAVSRAAPAAPLLERPFFRVPGSRSSIARPSVLGPAEMRAELVEARGKRFRATVC